jgi:mannan endo-1,4-beta-mannosidase
MIQSYLHSLRSDSIIQTFLLSGGPLWIFVRVATLTFVIIAVLRMLPGPNRQVPRYRARPVRAAMRYGTSWTAAGVLVVALAAVVAYKPPPLSIMPKTTGTLNIGMYAAGVNTSYTPETEFTSATGAKVSYVLSYSAFPGPFNTGFANLVTSHGSVPVIQILPYNTSMQGIADGAYDNSLKTYADEAKAFGGSVILSFAPEANGDWYTWGYGNTPASTWVAAWQHVVTVFKQQGATNVSWMWTMNSAYGASGPVSDYWPGSAYVGIIGIDGYYELPSENFQSLFGDTIDQIREFAPKTPMMISETASGPVVGASQVAPLFAGVKADGLMGLIWFNQTQDDGIYHQDWRLQDNPSILAAFKSAVKAYP